ncbi:hypothetical protein, partial [Winkia neuii]|uniref:hypothetical protein n=1 Tax=Winkia neuii TaxID=33007 RepID=UPI00255792C2
VHVMPHNLFNTRFQLACSQWATGTVYPDGGAGRCLRATSPQPGSTHTLCALRYSQAAVVFQNNFDEGYADSKIVCHRWQRLSL